MHRLPRIIRRFDFRVFCWVFVGVMVITSIWAHLQPRVYESTAVLLLLRTGPQIHVGRAFDMPPPRPSERFPSIEEIDFGGVARRIPAVDHISLLEPYGYGPEGKIDAATDVLKRNLTVTPVHRSLLVKISYRHPSAEMALKMAALFMEECLVRHFRLREEEAAREIEGLGRRVKQQARVVENLEEELRREKERSAHASGGSVAFQEAYRNFERRLSVNRELLENLSVRAEKVSAESTTPTLRIVDHPVLSKPDEYVRSPIMEILSWRWAIAGVAGVMAAGWGRWRQLSRSRLRRRDTA